MIPASLLCSSLVLTGATIAHRSTEAERSQPEEVAERTNARMPLATRVSGRLCTGLSDAEISPLDFADRFFPSGSRTSCVC